MGGVGEGKWEGGGGGGGSAVFFIVLWAVPLVDLILFATLCRQAEGKWEGRGGRG